MKNQGYSLISSARLLGHLERVREDFCHANAIAFGRAALMNADERYQLRCKCQTCGQFQDCNISDLTNGRADCMGLIRPDGIPQPCPGKLQPSEEPQDMDNNALALLAYAITSAGFLNRGQKRTLLQRLRQLEAAVGTAQAARTIADEVASVMSRPS